MLALRRSAWPTLEGDNVAVQRGVKEPQSQNAEKHSAFIRPKWSVRLSNPVSQLLALKRLVPQRVTDRARDGASSRTDAARCICDRTDSVCQRARRLEMRRRSDFLDMRSDRNMAPRIARIDAREHTRRGCVKRRESAVKKTAGWTRVRPACECWCFRSWPFSGDDDQRDPPSRGARSRLGLGLGAQSCR